MLNCEAMIDIMRRVKRAEWNWQRGFSVEELDLKNGMDFSRRRSRGHCSGGPESSGPKYR